MSQHSHHHEHNASSTVRLFITMALNFIITIAEVIGGLISGSLSLLSDALHNFSDGLALIITYIAIRLNQKPRNEKYTFGLKRAEILAAVINACTLIIISFFLLKEAWVRFFDPQPIAAGLMMATALIGLAANVIGTLLLRRDAANNLNMRAAYLHLLSDAVSSVAVIIGGFAIYMWDVFWVDPILTVLISLYVLRESYLIVKESVNVIMMGSPAHIPLDKIKAALEEIKGVNGIHHVHCWRLSEHAVHFEAHVEVNDIKMSESNIILEKVEKTLKNEFNIKHTTLQLEYARGHSGKLLE